jgi:[protein-PII] uridylyltransferase
MFNNFDEFVKSKIAEKEELFAKIRLYNRKRGTIRDSVKKHTLWVDKIIKEYLSGQKEIEKKFCAVALGGYGRSQLNPYSDLDIMLLTKIDINEDIVRNLYDILYSLGYECYIATRNIDECIELSKKDDTIKTSLFDSRYIVGNKILYKEYNNILIKDIINYKKRDFIDRKLEYMEKRYSQYGNTVFVLEPNIKEGVGSLRDYHTLNWIGKVQLYTKSILDMKKKNIISQEDYIQMRNSLYFLWQMRNALHFLTNKKTDILYLDLRDKVASEMGYESSKRFSAQERLMRKYYYHARSIERITQKYLDLMLKKDSMSKKSFFISNDILLDKQKICNKSKLLDIFDVLIMFYYSALYGVGVSLESLDKMKKITSLNIRKKQKDKNIAFTFRNILSLDKPISKTLRIMHESGFLDRYIPEFGNICCLSEFSLYHKYTVDEHSIQAFEHLDKLYSFDIPKTFITRLSYIWKTLPPHDRFILRLAVLLHDIGKIKKENHAIVGAELAKNVAKRLNLGNDLTEKLIFLIKNHLLISQTISTRDIDDPKTLSDFVLIVNDKNKLKLLSLLSYVDMKSVNDNVWNSWRESLIEALYLKTVYYLEDKNYDEFLRINAKESRRIIKSIVGKDYENLVEEFPDNIFNDIDDESMSKYIKNIQDTKKSVFIYKTGKDIDKLIVYYKNEFGFFHKISGVLACFNINIISAKSYNLKNGMIVDVFNVNIPKDYTIDAISIENMLNDVENGKIDLNQRVLSKKSVFLSRTQKAKLEISLSQIDVVVDNDLSDMYTVIRVYAQDRIGLVYDITKVFYKFKMHIGMFILDTKGAIAVDTFYVVDERYKKIYLDKLVNLIKSGLYEVLSFEI